MKENGDLIVQESGELSGGLLPPAGMVPGVTAQKVQTAYMTAVQVQKPRVLDQIVDDVLREAEYAGEEFFYAWGQGQNHVEGASIGLTLSVARAWGNCAVETEVSEEGGAWLFTSHFIDLEKGFTISRTFRQSKKWVVRGRMDEMRKDDTRFQLGQSKSIRNVVKAAVPSWLIQQAIDKAKEAVVNKITKAGIAASIEKAIKALAQHGVTEEQALAKIGRSSKHEVTVEDIVDLRTAWSAINKGEEFADRIFPPTNGEGKPASSNRAADATAEKPNIPEVKKSDKAPAPESKPGKAKKSPPKKSAPKTEPEEVPLEAGEPEDENISTAGPGESLKNLVKEGRKILGDEKFVPIFRSVNKDAKSLSELDEAELNKVLSLVNMAVDALEEGGE